MPTPFPGMDPYLEQPGIWHQVHADLIVDIRRFLTPRVRPRYYVAIEHMTYLTVFPLSAQRTGVPDVMVVTAQNQPPLSTSDATAMATGVQPIVAELPQPEEVHHRYLEIRDTDAHTVITTIEILSPANKIGREGRQQYEDKRLKVLGSLTNLVEIDLLRSGEPLPMRIVQHNDYRIVVSRSQQRPCADVYLFSVRQPIPAVPIPLRPGEAEPVVPLDQLLHDLYDQGSYDLMIDYYQPPAPPLSEPDATWAAGLLSR